MYWPKRTLATVSAGGDLPTGQAEEICPFLQCDSRGTSASAWGDKLGYGLFLLTTATLLLRPADWLVALQGMPIYEFIIASCMCFSIPRMLRQFDRGSPSRPITLLILGVLICIVMSHLARLALSDARAGGTQFLKVFVFYLLVLAWLDTPGRLRQFMLCVCLCALGQTIVCVLEYKGSISLSTLRSVEQADFNPTTGVTSVLRRLCGIGIFDDPNDLCVLLVATAVLCYGFMSSRSMGISRIGWIVPLCFCIYAITLTGSRGGLLALLAAIGTLLVARYGRDRAILAAIVIAPIILVVFAGRQTRVDPTDTEDTFQTRLDSWNDSLNLIRQYPVFGAGQEQQVALRGSVAHNSFIQSFAELGFVGGACFLGAFGAAIVALGRTNLRKTDPELARFRAIIMAIVIGYAVGMLALSRSYTTSPYLVLGLAGAFINITPRIKPLRLDARFVERLVAASVFFVIATYFFVHVMSV